MRCDVEIADASHLAPYTHAADVARLLVEFLRTAGRNAVNGTMFDGCTLTGNTSCCQANRSRSENSGVIDSQRGPPTECTRLPATGAPMSVRLRCCATTCRRVFLMRTGHAGLHHGADSSVRALATPRCPFHAIRTKTGPARCGSSNRCDRGRPLGSCCSTTTSNRSTSRSGIPTTVPARSTSGRRGCRRSSIAVSTASGGGGLLVGAPSRLVSAGRRRRARPRAGVIARVRPMGNQLRVGVRLDAR